MGKCQVTSGTITSGTTIGIIYHCQQKYQMKSKIPLILFNSLGRLIQEFVPMQAGAARLYSCGPTVYHYAHIGNLRAYIFTDTLRRVLQWKGYDVFHVMNITDVGHLTSDADEGEDKVERAAQQENKSIWEIADFYTKQFQHDLQLLNIQSPSLWTKATDHIQEMINFAMTCEQNGYTYVLDDGLYFDTAKVKNYGALALLDLSGQEEGARVARIASKRNPADFVLWRRSPTNAKRLMEWHSPWGMGAPGWHLECSAMSIKYLGEQFDIHTGGIDHRQIHHCNEIAQNQAFLGSDSAAANFWLHNEFLNMTNQKMSKSTGHFIRLQNLIDLGIHPLVFRYFCLMATYRTPLDFSMEAVVAAKNGLVRLLKRIDVLKKQSKDYKWLATISEARYSNGAAFTFIREEIESGLSNDCKSYIEKFDAAISDDLNIPQGLALLSSVVTDQNLVPDDAIRLIAAFDLVFGLQLLELSPQDLNIRPASASIDESIILEMIDKRNSARNAHDFKAADEIRNTLLSKGVSIMDTNEGSSWEWLVIPQ